MMPQGLQHAIWQIADRELTEVLTNNKTLDDAIATIQAEGEVSLEILQSSKEK
ncbi:hypothetical protein ACFSTH_13115 [Paenibacillus yanchengensis]|uniref:Uncharacterized protein n=1 Tax=Paenibacillus yanchengensis TaxID=2035833 RepID=A0ABW4YNH9_9BACL